MVAGGRRTAPSTAPDDLRAAVAAAEAAGTSRKDAIVAVARAAGVPKREVYDLVHRAADPM